MRRLLWLGAGFVLGAAATPVVTSRVRRSAPVRAVRVANGSYRRVRRAVGAFFDEFHDGMQEREAQLRAAREHRARRA
ncbi:hypothetical protein CS0771_63570 [Catellatospora sp. IY07-71]|uniref:hypothetical protein n=1 Tax=Catellatospora sp. IY07-71 TaxID=2728827 RepID=UPI001BB4581E|nr:hypothetical protein [Catellatospora sp. IY07-71]BCJ76813.1 hypothetical protein CS0771_63570 [Catellatospora sp. IY07-71]